ncbi:MAG TPA: formate--tetrahydrofolate ligase [Chitinophagaceae bacterium]|nr:formate--tetrahydrofolate ligase [Chitinophagaceae bacterium]MCB9056260.1 formate--tetrahydrofolate ligase [Chitinophagales bacterium]HPG10082.1 formate--tetrahydrofolate ligase [Chitinophagaceae bacterium]
MEQHQIKPIGELATEAGIDADDLITFGKYKAKINCDNLDEKRIHNSKLILITSITPTKAGNGKTTTSIGLADGLNRIGKKAILALREPSLGPCFGMKGGATGGGRSTLHPSADINLHFNGDFHMISAANNMLAALLDNYNFHKQGSPEEMKDVYWRRVLDVNDRSLRFIITGLHGEKNGLPAETGFDITPASELMAVLCLSHNLEELRERIDSVLLGFTANDKPFTTKGLGVSGAITALLKDALLPNLVQTAEGNPAILHGGPFANIAHGCNSILATKTAMHYGDYVLTEAGFGSDLGAEKFFNIKCRKSGIVPALSILVVTTQSIKLHGEVPVKNIKLPDQGGLLKGMRNVEKHINILQSFGQKVMVVLNQFDFDTKEETDLIANWCKDNKIVFAVNSAYNQGGEGCIDAAKKIVELTAEPANDIQFTYDLNDSVDEKIRKVVRTIYGGDDIILEKKARRQLKRINELGYDKLPVCIAKTQYSFTDVPEHVHKYNGFIISVDELIVNAGAGFIVAVCGDMMRMPGLPTVPAANSIDIVNGEITGV